MKFRPCIDLHMGKVKQIVGNTLSDSSGSVIENYVAPYDAEYYANLFKADGLTGGHVIMLGPGNKQQTYKALNTFPGGMQVGGGIVPENAEQYINSGATHVIVTSYLFDNGILSMKKLDRISSLVGKDKLVIDLSCKKIGNDFYVTANRWQTVTDFKITIQNLKQLASYCDEFLIHSVDVEGQRKGIMSELVKLLGDIAPVKTTYAGGVSSKSDIDDIYKLGRGKVDVTIGSALDIFGGNLIYKEIISFINKKEFNT